MKTCILGCLLVTLYSCNFENHQRNTGAVAEHAMVVTAHPEATRISLGVLREGGNAIDAAAAAGFIPGYESEATTHYSIVDAEGNAVAGTTTLNRSFGSKIVIQETGILLNNQMDDFSIKPGVPNAYGLTGGEANAIQPGKRKLSSMTPTIVKKTKSFIWWSARLEDQQ